jgi:hypothetical protein
MAATLIVPSIDLSQATFPNGFTSPWQSLALEINATQTPSPQALTFILASSLKCARTTSAMSLGQLLCITGNLPYISGKFANLPLRKKVTFFLHRRRLIAWDTCVSGVSPMHEYFKQLEKLLTIINMNN